MHYPNLHSEKAVLNSLQIPPNFDRIKYIAYYTLLYQNSNPYVDLFIFDL